MKLDPEVITEVLSLLRQIDVRLIVRDEDFLLDAEVRSQNATKQLVKLLREELSDGQA